MHINLVITSSCVPYQSRVSLSFSRSRTIVADKFYTLWECLDNLFVNKPRKFYTAKGPVRDEGLIKRP
jgi:hypothetical protein